MLLVAHLHFFLTHKTNAKKCKRATNPTHNDTSIKHEMNRTKKGLQLTRVWQNGGRSAKFEHSYFYQH